METIRWIHTHQFHLNPLKSSVFSIHQNYFPHKWAWFSLMAFHALIGHLPIPTNRPFAQFCCHTARRSDHLPAQSHPFPLWWSILRTQAVQTAQRRLTQIWAERTQTCKIWGLSFHGTVPFGGNWVKWGICSVVLMSSTCFYHFFVG